MSRQMQISIWVWGHYDEKVWDNAEIWPVRCRLMCCATPIGLMLPVTEIDYWHDMLHGKCGSCYPLTENQVRIKPFTTASLLKKQRKNHPVCCITTQKNYVSCPEEHILIKGENKDWWIQTEMIVVCNYILKISHLTGIFQLELFWHWSNNNH